MLEVKIFKDERFGEIRTMTDDHGQVWFVGKDVALALGYSNTRDAIRKHVDDEDKTTVAFCDTGSNYKSKTAFINESGLYSLILSSKLEQAVEFKRWVTSDVLPKIRQTGAYLTKEKMLEVLTKPESVMDLCRALVKLDGQRQEAEQQAVVLRGELRTLDEKVSELRPKAEYCDKVLDSVSCMTTTQVAKGLGMSAVELNRLLCERKVQYGQSGQYMLYADYARRDLAKNRTSLTANGHYRTRPYLVWTERGREFICSLVNRLRQVPETEGDMACIELTIKLEDEDEGLSD